MNKDLVDQALAIIGDGARQRNSVEFAMNFVSRAKSSSGRYSSLDLSSGRYGTLTKGQKIAARQFAKALKNLESALKSADLSMDLRLGFPMDGIDFKEWQARAEEAAKTPLRATGPTNPAKNIAAQKAAQLLEAARIPVSSTRGGKFCKLAAILFGDPEADLFYQCRKVIADRNRD